MLGRASLGAATTLVESGPAARPVALGWVVDARKQAAMPSVTIDGTAPRRKVRTTLSSIYASRYNCLCGLHIPHGPGHDIMPRHPFRPKAFSTPSPGLAATR